MDNSLIKVKRRGKYGVVDNEGVNVIPILHDELIYISADNTYLTMMKGTWETREF